MVYLVMAYVFMAYAIMAWTGHRHGQVWGMLHSHGMYKYGMHRYGMYSCGLDHAQSQADLGYTLIGDVIFLNISIADGMSIARAWTGRYSK